MLASVKMCVAQNAQLVQFGDLEVNPLIPVQRGISPLVAVQQGYDSNIYLDKNAPKAAWINRSGVGVGFVSKGGSRLDLNGSYMLEFLSYSRSPKINNATHHLATLSAKVLLPRNTSVTLDEDYKQTTDQATSELTARALRVENTAGVAVEAPLRGKLGFNLAAQHTYNNYLAGIYNVLDRQEVLAGGDITYKVQPKTNLVLGYRYGTMNYRLASAESGDSSYNNLSLGLTGNIAPKLAGLVMAGVQFRNYEQHLNQAKDKATIGGYSARLAWKPEELTDVIFYAKRAGVETTYLNSRYYISSMGDVELSRQVRKIKASLGLGYESVVFPEKTAATGKKRRDNNTGVRLTAEYNIQTWLKAGAAYAYKNRASNESAFAYSDNLVSIDLKGMF